MSDKNESGNSDIVVITAFTNEKLNGMEITSLMQCIKKWFIGQSIELKDIKID